jgi:hypothetical protein
VGLGNAVFGLKKGISRFIGVTDVRIEKMRTVMDKDRVPQLVQLGSYTNSIDDVQALAMKVMNDNGYGYTLHNACAATLSEFLNLAGIDVPITLGAGNLARRITARGWQKILVEQQQAGDVAVAENDVHIFLVVEAVDKDKMVIADNQAPSPHIRYASGSGGKTPVSYFLRANGMGPFELETPVETPPTSIDPAIFPQEDEDTNTLREPLNTNGKQVIFTRYTGGGSISSWIEAACAPAGVPFTGYWLKGLETLCQRESSDLPNAINDWDSNATGPIVSDGYPQNCSRGVAQCTPPTFAAYHAVGTTWEIYNPTANIAAAIIYIRSRYGVQQDGSDLAAKVQQADPTRPPRGYIVKQAKLPGDHRLDHKAQPAHQGEYKAADDPDP